MLPLPHMARRKTKRAVEIRGEKVQLELRLCANRGCNAEFWVSESSNQSICSGKCFEFTNHRPFWKQQMPPIRRYGDKPLEEKPANKRGPKAKAEMNGFGAANYAHWQLAKALNTAASKKHGAKARELPEPLPSTT